MRRPRAACLPLCTLSLILWLFAGTVQAQELDFTLESRIGAYSLEDPRLMSESAAGAELSWILGPDTDLLVAGSYGYGYDETADHVETFLPALDRARFSGRSRADGSVPVLSLTAGRYGFRDSSGLVVQSPADGAQVALLFPGVTLRAEAAYTGFLFRETTNIRITSTDGLDEDNLFGPAHVLGRAEVSFPEVVSRQSLVFDAVGHLDAPELPTSDDDLPDDDGTGIYTVGTLTGPITTRIFYGLHGIGRFARYDADTSRGGTSYEIAASAAGGSLRAFAPAFGKSRAEVEVYYASGQAGFRRFSASQGGTNAFFSPIADPGLFRFAAVPFSNILAGGLSYSVQPFDLGTGPREGLRTEIRTIGAYRPFRGPGSLDGLADDTRAGYLGTELTLLFEYRPFSDLRLTAEGNVFLPTSIAVDGGAASNTDPQSRVMVGAELSL